MGRLHVGALQTSNNGNLQVQRLDGVDETVSDSITTHNTAENVDKDGRDLGVAGDQLESLLNGRGSSTTTNIQEVGGLAAIQLDDVHSSHGKTGAVNEAADITIQLDEVQAGLGSTDLISVLLGLIAHLEDVLLPEVGVVVKTELGVHAHNLVVRGLGQRVDLDLGGVLLAKDLVQVLDGLLGFGDALLAEAELVGDIQSHLVSDTDVDVNVCGVDGIGVLLSNTLNVHATLRRRHDDGTLGGTVHEDGQVELAASELALANVDGAAETAASASLLGDELVADHVLGEQLGLGRRVDNAHTSLQAIVKGTLATATGQDLGLDDHVIATNLLRDSLSLSSVLGVGTLGYIDVVLAQEVGG